MYYSITRKGSPQELFVSTRTEAHAKAKALAAQYKATFKVEEVAADGNGCECGGDTICRD